MPCQCLIKISAAYTVTGNPENVTDPVAVSGTVWPHPHHDAVRGPSAYIDYKQLLL